MLSHCTKRLRGGVSRISSVVSASSTLPSYASATQLSPAVWHTVRPSMSCFSSSSFTEDIEKEFKQMSTQIGAKVLNLDDDTKKLKFYALYKQATEGDNKEEKPGYFSGGLAKNMKWEEWNKLKGTPKEEAMKQYLDLAKQSFDLESTSGNQQVWPAFQAKTTPMLPKGTFDGQVALVTGGGTGLGKAMATMLSELGATVCISSRKREVIDATAKEITEKTGRRVIAIPADVRDADAVTAALDELEREAGLPDVVINNAAGNFISPSERLSPNAFRTIVDIVLNGTANVTLQTGKRMINAKKGGVFLSVTTTYADTGSGYVTPSAAAKAGVANLVRSLASEWDKYGMRFVGVSPGPIETEGAFSRLDPTGEFKDLMISRLAARRLGEPEELANMACFLVSPYASWVTGQLFTLDGGEKAKLSGEMNALDRVTPEMWDKMEEMIRGKGNK
eukprot:gb/GECG01014447.1/.p1 GENE.gb/GECG01014447.1/~~gb/GECG01014447.1/.p1  ORF type:complete len:449 (+),score=76.93 gb/GECG01014447.1/:1-1347(+)